MRSPLHELGSVGAKVTWIVVIVSAAAVVAVTLTSGIRGYLYLKQHSIEAVMSQSLIVAESSSAALSFRDREMAAGALAALKEVKGLQQASLIDAEGRVFSRYTPAAAGVAAASGALYPVGHWRNGDGHALVVPVSDRAGAHGRLQVDYLDEHLKTEALALALQAALLSLAAVLLALILARKLHPALTAPIVELENTARHVRDTGDYSARARRVSNDELGRLTADFNQMLQRIESSQRDLLQAQRRAEESSRLKDEFVATLSHELRTPLSPIVAWIHMLRMPQGAAQLDNGLNVMERNANALIRIIDDLLDMSRIVSGTLRLDVQPVDINAIIRAAAETLAPAAASRQIDVDVQLVSPPPLNGDSSRLQQVVWNLLSNAIKFSPHGGRVTVQTLREGARLDLVFKDAGIGIDPGFLPFVFDRFRQQDGSITRTHGGLGLGLSIVRQLVELHGGTVDAQSLGPGQGATFVVSLPVARHPSALPAAAAPAAAAARPRLDGMTIMLVEDEADMRAVIRSVLQDAGATVHESAGAHEALALFDRCEFDALVSDIGLPDMDGYELLAQLRQTPRGLAVPALALTAYARPEEQRRAFDAGYRAHLSKPVEPSELVEAVAAAVEFSRSSGASTRGA